MGIVEFDSIPPPTSSSREEPARMSMVTLHEEISLGRVFTTREASLVRRISVFSADQSGRVADELKITLDRGYRSLGSLALALEAYPSMRMRDTLGDRERSIETLMASVLEGGEHGVEWSLPTKAALSRSFGIAKVNFFNALKYALCAERTPEGEVLIAGVEEAIEEAVYTRLAEELYRVFVTSKVVDKASRRVAMEHLIDLWERRVGFATYRFCPILRSAWAARKRATRVFGTLMGTSELSQLLFQDCDDRFVLQFTADHQDTESAQALEEFLFDLSTEQLAEIRLNMAKEDKRCVGAPEVAKYIGCTERQLPSLMRDPRNLYRSFRMRSVHAQYRRSMGVPGPKRTAEAYVLEAILRDEARNA